MKTAVDIQSKKIELIQWLSTIDDLAVINKLMELKKQENKDWWNAMPEGEQNSVEEGLDDAETGKLNSHSQAKKLYGKWL